MSNQSNSLKLGFGLMRLPKKRMGKTDLEQTKKMVDQFIQAGGTYFDTAFIYGTSESDIRKALVERYPRESYTLATKLNALFALSEKQAKNQFYRSLERTKAGYFDYYLLHAIMNNNYRRYDKFDLWAFGKELKEKGLIKNLGFSFHGSPELLERLLNEHPDIDFVQLQINYADWENEKVASRKNYEIARRHNKDIVIMEPVKGGKLASPGKEIEALFSRLDPEASPASYALRFAAGLDGILSVLSGMSNTSQMEDNLKTFSDFKPLDAAELEAIAKAQKILSSSAQIECTACSYCTKNCPKGIEIPEIFAAYNTHLSSGQLNLAKEQYETAVQKGADPRLCVICKSCEGACPQHLEITSLLQKAADTLDPLPRN